MPAYERDPVSEGLTRAARSLLGRAYATPGVWVSTRLADPDGETIARFRAEGIDVTGPDNAPSTGPGARTATPRWARGYVRALYYQHLWFSELGGRGWRAVRRTEQRRAGALRVNVGRHVPELGVIPAGRIVSAVLLPGGQRARDAAERAPSAPADATRREWEAS
jgi:hypothetical protein